jgi:signal transduction histidine kinase/ActR/RegA family two-component response regulator
MAEEHLYAEEEDSGSSLRTGWVTAGALLATVLLILLIAMVTISNRQRDEALAWERRTTDVILLTRSVDASIARAEAALGRYVLDELQTTGTSFYQEWRLASSQIEQLRRQLRGNNAQMRRVDELRALMRQRQSELDLAVTATRRGQAGGGTGYFYQAGQSRTLPNLRSKLNEIGQAERETLRTRMAETRLFAQQADRFTDWLGWFAVLIGLGAIALSVMAYRALIEGRRAREEADTEANRAQALERAVQERTRELSEANERLLAEAGERAAAEAKLRQVQKMEAVGQLTGGIAHDFNNMLAVVVGGLDLAKRKLRGPKRDVELHLDNAMEGATRAAALTRRLLAFARSEPLLPEGIAPSSLLEGMADLIDRTIGERISVETRVPDEHWHVWADSNQLENAVLNLCVNARDAMEGSGELCIEVDNLSLGDGQVNELPADDYVRISVVDTGVGIAPEHLERVFEPFFTTKPVGKGTGLGLSQIFGFARQSGGDVTVESQVGKGTRVSIYLPRSDQAAERAAARQEQAALHQEEARGPAPGATILVVEDDPRVSRSTVSALEELGYRPIACSSGREALEVLERGEHIDLVITDVMMPEMTGPELVRILSRRHSGISVLFVTGYVGEAGDADDLSGYGILRKPFTVAALASAVSSALSHRPGPMAAAAAG